jgi:dynactin complex subunit
MDKGGGKMRNSVDDLQTRNIALENTILALGEKLERAEQERDVAASIAVERGKTVKRLAEKIEGLELGITDALIMFSRAMDELRSVLKEGE